MKKQKYLYVMALAITGLMISSAAGLSTQMNSGNENNFFEEDNNSSNIIDEVAIEDVIDDGEDGEPLPDVMAKINKILAENKPVGTIETKKDLSIQSTPLERNTMLVELDEEKEMELEQFEKPNSRHTYIIEARHPALSDDGDGKTLIMYDLKFQNFSDPTADFDDIIWSYSDDYGESWGSEWHWVDLTNSYPASDYWGYSTFNNTDQSFATFVQPNEDFYYEGPAPPDIGWYNGTNVTIMRITHNDSDPLNPDVSLRTWFAFGDTHYDMEMADMASSDGLHFPTGYEDHDPWGIASYIMSNTAGIGGPNAAVYPVTGGTHMFYPVEYQGITAYALMTWFTEDPDGANPQPTTWNCEGTAVTIDDVTKGAYAVWDPQDVVAPYQRGLMIAKIYDMNVAFDYVQGVDIGYGVTWNLTNPDLDLEKPAVTANNDKVVIATLIQNATTPTEKWLSIWYSLNGEVNSNENLSIAGIWSFTDTIVHSVEISHVVGETFMLHWIMDNKLYAAFSFDNGVTWSDMGEGWISYYQWSGEEVVIEEYRSCDISENAHMSIWEYDSTGGDVILGKSLYYTFNTVKQQGHCTYAGLGFDVPYPEVEVYVNNSTWKLKTIGNATGHYELTLLLGLEVWTNVTNRIIAKEVSPPASQVNITDYKFETIDPVNTIDMILDIYYLDLIDFPMYLADNSSDPTKTFQQMTGPAVVQMNIDYMRWNKTVDPGGAPTWSNDSGHTQLALFTSNVSGTYYTADEMRDALNALKGDSYNFGVYHNSVGTDILGDICYWIDYEAPHDPGYPDHVPGAVPAYGDYSNWMSIRGIHTDADPYPAGGSFTVHGLWVNDPLPSGIGENTYKMASGWLASYYSPLTGGPYDNEYVAVCEPPENAVSDIELIETTQYWDIQLPDPNGGSNFLNQIFNHLIIRAATTGARDRLSPYDDNFEGILEQTYPGQPMLVKNLVVGDEKHDFYIVPYDNVPTSFMKKGGHSQGEDEKTLAAVIINAETGQFEEASWVDAPVKYPVTSETEARQIVYDMLIDLGYDPDELPARAIQMDLVYRGDYSLFSPEWRASVLGMELFV